MNSAGPAKAMRYSLGVLMVFAACGRSGLSPQLHTLDLTHFVQLDQSTGPLHAINDSLVIPLDVEHDQVSVTEQAPDRLLSIYTRVGCTPADGTVLIRAIGSTSSSAQVVARARASLQALSVSFYGVNAQNTETPTPVSACFGLRTVDGVWHDHLAPVAPTVDASGRSGTASFVIDEEADVDAVAIVFDYAYLFVNSISFTTR